MSFLNIDVIPQTQPKQSPGWLLEDVAPPAPLIRQSTDTTPSNPQASEILVWDYPEMEEPEEYPTFRIDNVNHRLPKQLKKLSLSNRDWICYMDTVWMCCRMNVRWSIFEALVPTHLRDLVGGSRVLLNCSIDDKSEVIWSVHD